MAGDRRQRAELLADIALFAPLGLAASVAEALPSLASKGRARLLPKLTLARTVGQFAVDEGYRRVVALTGRPKPSVGDLLSAALGWAPWLPRSSSRPGGQHPGEEPSARPTTGDGHRRAGQATSQQRHHGAAVKPANVPSPGELAIPSYDSLSAPQVVRLLAGLSREEIEAVRRYEAATRGRRTILARAEQLLA